ncbi:DUF58 domain-containing protein, partial [Oleiphilus sp. HI0117]
PLAERVGEMIASRSKRSDYFRLSQKNIYIFPSRAGFAYLLLLLLMLITAINYQNSLIYLFTFFLGAIFFFSIWMCFLNMSGLEISSAKEEGVFEGERGYFYVKYRKEQGVAFGLKVGFDAGQMSAVPPVTNNLNEYPVQGGLKNRGYHTLKRLRLESCFPFGLVRAWTWLKLDASLLVYPKPVEGSPTKAENSAEKGLRSDQRSDDYNSLRAYQAGDSMQRINWKKYASSELLVVKDNDLTASDASRVRWQDYEPYGKEQRLQFMCEKITRLYKAKQAFGLELPVIVIEPDSSEAHYYACLKQLALY